MLRGSIARLFWGGALGGSIVFGTGIPDSKLFMITAGVLFFAAAVIGMDWLARKLIHRRRS